MGWYEVEGEEDISGWGLIGGRGLWGEGEVGVAQETLVDGREKVEQHLV